MYFLSKNFVTDIRYYGHSTTASMKHTASQSRGAYIIMDTTEKLTDICVYSFVLEGILCLFPHLSVYPENKCENYYEVRLNCTKISDDTMVAISHVNVECGCEY